jgi:D-alanyl-D-alanine carboxypeptidase/D-alanyl-D-alanine-endopeptidase (penicillin-binding protein 4)
MYRADQAIAQTYIQSLPVGGEDGTLRRRFKRPRTIGTVHAKSGHIRHVVALSGYIVHDHAAYAFSIILNDYAKPTYKGKRLIDQIVYLTDEYIDEISATTAEEPAEAVGG